MKTLLVFAFLVLSMSAQAVRLESFTLKRAGKGQHETMLTVTETRVLLKLLTCNFQDASHIPAISIMNPTLVNDIIAIFNGTAIIGSNMTPQTFPLPRTWLGASYKAEGDSNIIIVQRPFIVMDGVVSDVLERVDGVAQKICYKN